MSILQALYDSEINCSVSTFWDSGFFVRLGDHLNGFVAETDALTLREAEEWLKAEAVKRYPDSEFAKEHGGFNA